jgi:hypothetical protein
VARPLPRTPVHSRYGDPQQCSCFARQDAAGRRNMLLPSHGSDRLCTKSPVRNLTQRSIRTFWSHFDSFLRSERPILHIKSILKEHFWCKAGAIHEPPSFCGRNEPARTRRRQSRLRDGRGIRDWESHCRPPGTETCSPGGMLVQTPSRPTVIPT